MNPKTKRVIMLIFNVIAIGMVVLGGIMKLSGGPEIKAVLTKAGVGPYIPMLGTMELVFAALYIYPKTMRIGFLLLTCYFAGAIAAELSHGGPVTNAIMVQVLIWIGAFLRDRSLFLPTSSGQPS